MEEIEKPIQKRLTPEDIKELKSDFLPYIIVSTCLFLIGSMVIIALNNVAYPSESKLFTSVVLLKIFGLLCLSIFIGFYFSFNIIKDLRLGEKILEKKTVQKKQFIIDYEAGSAAFTFAIFGKKMKQFDSYSIIMDDLKYRVDKDLYNAIEEGDEVFFHTSIYSNELLKIELIS